MLQKSDQSLRITIQNAKKVPIYKCTVPFTPTLLNDSTAATAFLSSMATTYWCGRSSRRRRSTCSRRRGPSSRSGSVRVHRRSSGRTGCGSRTCGALTKFLLLGVSFAQACLTAYHFDTDRSFAWYSNPLVQALRLCGGVSFQEVRLLLTVGVRERKPIPYIQAQ